MFEKVYGCSYNVYVTRKANNLKPTWLQSGYELLPSEKHGEWTQFVNYVIDNISFYNYGNPINETLEIIARINSIDDLEELKNLIASIDGSHNILVRNAIQFSNKGELVSTLYDEVRAVSKR